MESLSANLEHLKIDEISKKENLSTKEDDLAVENEITATCTENDYSADIAKIEQLFNTLDYIDDEPKADSENDSLISFGKLMTPIYSHSPFACNWPSYSENTNIPDIDLDYDNIFDDMSKLCKMEKKLQLLYRPFTCLMDVNCRFSMYELCILISDASYEPGCHPSVSIRLRNPSALVKIYAGGKIFSSALTADSARRALVKVVRNVQDLDYKAEVKNFSKNIVHASFCMPFKLDLKMLTELHGEHVSYNPTRPFITYNIEDTEIKFAIFPTGYVLVLHSSKHSETRAAISAFLPILALFKDENPSACEKQGIHCGDISYKLLWERKLEDDKDGVLLHS